MVVLTFPYFHFCKYNFNRIEKIVKKYLSFQIANRNLIELINIYYIKNWLGSTEKISFINYENIVEIVEINSG